MQTAPWLGIIPGADGQILHSQDGDSPIVNLFKSAASAIVSNPGNPNGMSYYTMSKQAEAAGFLLYHTQTTSLYCSFDNFYYFAQVATFQFCQKLENKKHAKIV